MKFDRSVWGLLIIGIVMRCVALNQPLVDAHLIRQCFTAAATKDLIDEPNFHLSSRVSWMGDLAARYIQELPIYNYLVVGVHRLIGHLDLSGKVTSILLWAASFFCLQFIWRRMLNPRQVFWANLVFVIAPLSVFFLGRHSCRRCWCSYWRLRSSCWSFVTMRIPPSCDGAFAPPSA